MNNKSTIPYQNTNHNPQTSTKPLQISNYITKLILPKCNMVYSESISTVYFQILININNQKNCKKWQQNKSWIQPETIAKNTGYTTKTVLKCIKILNNLELITWTKKEKLNLYELKNEEFSSLDLFLEFNKKFNTNLLKEVKDNKVFKIKQKISKIEKHYQINKNSYLIKKLWFSDINKIRSSINQAESIYKGSSLFFINNIATTLLDEENDQLYDLSESKRALLNGSSQSTISRYISQYKLVNFLNVIENNINKPIKLSINELKKNEEKVVSKKMENKLICPICKKEFDEVRSLGVHISKTKDKKHTLLSHLKRQTKCKPHDLEKLYLEYKEDFDLCIEEVVEPKIKKTEKEKVKTTQTSGESVPNLLKYFYSKTGGVSPNWGKECGQIKNLIKMGITSDDIKLTMDMLIRKGNIDLRFLNRSVNEAKMEQQYLNDTVVDGTEAYLVKMYYDGLGFPLNLQTLIRDVQKIKETINTGLTYDQAKMVVQYMIDIKCPTLNFIGTKRNEALTRATKLNAGKNNPSFFDRDDLVTIRSELSDGRYNLNKANDMFKNDAKLIAIKMFKEGNFSSKYSHLEWAFKVGLDLDKEMYRMAIELQKSKEFALDRLLRDRRLPDDKRRTMLRVKDNFYKWLEMYENRYKEIN